MRALRARTPRQARWQAVPDRVAQPLRLSRRMPCADAGGRSPGRDLAARRQKSGCVSSPLRWSSSITSLSLIGIALGKQELDFPRFSRYGSANILFAAGGHFSAVADGQRGAAFWTRSRPGHRASQTPATAVPAKRRRHSAHWIGCAGSSRARGAPRPRNVFPRILDEYVVREFLIMFALVLAGFVHAHACLHLL